jgi:hypothetical protein
MVLRNLTYRCSLLKILSTVQELPEGQQLHPVVVHQCNGQLVCSLIY